MNLEETQIHWNQLGADDPFWAVLTDPSKKGGRWNPKEFFQTGVDEINSVFADLTKRGIPGPKGKALDFGCGLGRLSQTLANQFDEVHGVDISPSMLEHANRFNRHGERCNYHLNNSSDLKLFQSETFDFIYSVIALQHMEARYQKCYIAEFFRLLKPGGVAVFQVISGRSWRRLVPGFMVAAFRRLKHGKQAYISMFGLNESELNTLLAEAGMDTLAVVRSPDDTGRWWALRYIVRKR